MAALPFGSGVWAEPRRALDRLPALMTRYRVSMVSVALIADGFISNSIAIGTARGTLFQAASVSKVVAALCVLRLAEQGKLSIDSPVNVLLRSWRLLGEQAGEVTPRLLLSHRAGTTVPGFPGYEPGAPLPNLDQILDGAAPANTPAVRQYWRPGTAFRYSSGGFMVLQKLVEDVAGRPFDVVARELVLGPAGMTESTFRQPPLAGAHVAVAHDAEGRPVPGGWHVYPELAAAGLWSNAEDLARLALAITGTNRSLLRPESRKEMTTPVDGGPTGLGVFVQTRDRLSSYVSHIGVNLGFKSLLAVAADGSFGVTILTDAERGNALIAEFVSDLFGEAGLEPLKLES